jgi:hypothetical protein
MSGLQELRYLMPFKTLLAYSPIKILAVRFHPLFHVTNSDDFR